MLIKICGIRLQEDVDCLIKAGIDFCGFIFHKESPRFLSVQEAAQLETGSMDRVGVFVNEGLEEILSAVEVARLRYVQLHGDYSEEVAREIGEERVIRVLWPERFAYTAQLYREMLRHSHCAYYLLDAGFSRGGSGRRFNWHEVGGMDIPRPWFLAGGLNENNFTQAMLIARPDGLDFNSGIESAIGKKKHEAIMKISERARLKSA